MGGEGRPIAALGVKHKAGGPQSELGRGVSVYPHQILSLSEGEFSSAERLFCPCALPRLLRIPTGDEV